MKNTGISRRACAQILICTAVSSLCNAAEAQQVIKGGGATSFPSLVYTEWGQHNDMVKGKIVLQYEATGSSNGLAALEKKTVDFASIDSPLKPEELTKRGWVQFPLYLGAVVPVVNLKGVPEIRMTPDVLARIFNGDISNWNDPAIRALNKDLTSHGLIKPISRGKENGTSEVFINYLAKSSDMWAKAYADNNKWKPVVTVKPVLEQVAYFNNQPGAISFAPYAIAVRENLNMVQLQNKSGKFVQATPASLAAASQVSRFGEKAGDYVDLPGDMTWPIASAGWIVMPRQVTEPDRAKAVLKFFFYALADDLLPPTVGLSTLPDRVKTRTVGKFREIVNGKGLPLDFMG